MANLDFIVAKVHGMRGLLYEEEPLRQLCNAASVEALAQQLAPNDPVGDAVGLQRVLTAEHLASLFKLYPLLDGWMAEFYLWLLRRYQAENLKVLMRGWAAKLDERAVARYLVRPPDKLALPVAEMMQAASMEALLDAVPQPVLREGPRMGLPHYEHTGQLFFLEAGLDRAYLAELKRLADRAPASQRGAAEPLVAFELDVYNLMLTLRGVFNYGLAFDILRPLLAPFGRYATARRLDALRQAPTREEAEELIPTALWHPGEGDAETGMRRRLYALANRQFYDAGIHFGAVVAFTALKRIELSNLVKISEGVRYGRPADAIRGSLIGRVSSQRGVA
jgi:vacuolar-type H+-ATPase subunit C/Vma6